MLYSFKINFKVGYKIESPSENPPMENKFNEPKLKEKQISEGVLMWM